MEDIRTLFDYNAWANARILDAVERVPTEILATASLGSCNLHDTLKHILGCEVGWRSAWQGIEQAEGEFPDRFPTAEALRTRWREEARRLNTFLDMLSDVDLARPMSEPPYEDSPETLGHPLQHVVNHGMQHRSELALLLTALGQSPGWMDFLIFLREEGMA